MPKTAARPYAVFDIDGTLIRWQLYHAIADGLVKLGHIDKAVFEDIREARMRWKRRTEKESFAKYNQELVDLYETMLIKLAVSDFEAAAEAVFNEYKDQVYTYTRDLIKQLKQDDYLLFAISGSQDEIVGKIAEYYGFDDWVGSVYERVNDRFTGHRQTALGAKDAVLAKLVKKHHAAQAGSVAVGDSTSDIAMLEAVERPITFNPEQKLFDYAKARGWRIVLERKNVVYELHQNGQQYFLA